MFPSSAAADAVYKDSAFENRHIGDHREQLASGIVRLCWQLQIAAVVGTLAWIALDGQFAYTAHSALRGIQEWFSNTSVYGPLVPPTSGVWMLYTLVSCTVLTLIGILVGLFHGSRTHRGLRSWFAFTALIAAWLGVIVGWRDLAWSAQQQRLKFQLPSFDKISASLAAAWPQEDGQQAELGTYMAYPVGEPTMLMVIASSTREYATPVVSVEKLANGALLFELGGNESGVWLERHPPYRTPQSFTGGLLTNYRLIKSVPLTGGWFASVYDVSYPRSSGNSRKSSP